MPTVGELAREIAFEVGEDYYGIDERTLFNSWTVDAIDEFLAEDDWPFSITSDALSAVASTSTYSLEADVGTVIEIVEDSTDDPLEYLPLDEVVERGYDLAQEGKPLVWIPYGLDTNEVLQIRLWPIPDTAYTYTVLSNIIASALTEDSDVPLPADAVRAIKYLIRERFYMNAENVAISDRERARYLRILAQLRKKHAEPQAEIRRFQYTDLPPSRAVTFRVPRLITE